MSDPGETRPKVSVVVAAYQPGDGINRVIDSLDAQTLPQDQFETIIVDDGSPDDTFARLQRIAATRPNMTVTRIENSGWPSRPRNIATDMARGEYLLFMDHDDSLYPDALRRSYEYASQTGADALSPKESKTSDVWWGLSSLSDGNVENAITDGGIDRLLPMVPHKFYRRDFLREQHIRFPEGRRMLWEDIYVNVEAYRRARVVSVLADTPVYLWHSSATNNSKSYGPTSDEFWDRLDDLFAFIDRTLDGPEFADARRSMLMHQYRGRALGRYARMLSKANPDETALGLRRARAIQERYIPLDWDAAMGKVDAARASLLRQERPDLLEALVTSDATIGGIVAAADVSWHDDLLHLSVEGRWETRSGGAPHLRMDGDRVVRVVPDAVGAALDPALLDVTDDIGSFAVTLGIREREARITWPVPAVFTPRLDADHGGVRILASAQVTVDIERAALGVPLTDAVWDLHGVTRWIGLSRGSALKTPTPVRPALLRGRAAIAYSNKSKNLSLDLAQRLRSIVKDGRPVFGATNGTIAKFTVALPGVHVVGETSVACDLVLKPKLGGIARRLAAVLPGSPRGPVTVAATIVGDAQGARLVGGGDVPAGTYSIAFRSPGAPALDSVFTLQVAKGGSIQFARPS